MKTKIKNLAFVVVALLLIMTACCTAFVTSARADEEAEPTPSPYSVYLVAGSMYYLGGYELTEFDSTAAVVKLTAAEEDAIFRENVYKCTAAAGEVLPIPINAREDLVFKGWEYAVDGIIQTVEVMPSTLSENIYLYPHWISVAAPKV